MRKDFPEKGSISIHATSLKNDEEMPEQEGKVRAHAYIMGFIFKPVIDEATGEEHCDVFTANSIDVNGYIPKFLVNNFSKSIPREQFQTFEAGGQKFFDWKAKQGK